MTVPWAVVKIVFEVVVESGIPTGTEKGVPIVADDVILTATGNEIPTAGDGIPQVVKDMLTESVTWSLVVSGSVDHSDISGVEPTSSLDLLHPIPAADVHGSSLPSSDMSQER